MKALERGLEQHIPQKTDYLKLQLKFEQLYQQIEVDANVNEEQRTTIKGKLLDTYTKCKKVPTTYAHRKTIQSLKRNEEIAVLKQDKGKGSVIIDTKDYIKKCEAILSTRQFGCCQKDPTQTIENKIQKGVRSITSTLKDREYQTIYPTGSRLGKFYGTAKDHKLKTNENVEHLELRPIIFNIGTASYHLAKHLAKILSLLNDSPYNISSTEHFINKLTNFHIPPGYQLVSFDVKSLYTNVPLQLTIDIIIHRIYENREISANINRADMVKLLQLRTSEIYFSFNHKIYRQVDGVAMGSPLGPVIAEILMSHLVLPFDRVNLRLLKINLFLRLFLRLIWLQINLIFYYFLKVFL